MQHPFYWEQRDPFDFQLAFEFLVLKLIVHTSLLKSCLHKVPVMQVSQLLKNLPLFLFSSLSFSMVGVAHCLGFEFIRGLLCFSP